jgi:phosphoribosylglycinamide formyltransferase-1
MNSMQVSIAVLASGRGSNFEALVKGNTHPGVVKLLLSDNPDAPVLDRAAELGIEAAHLSPGPYRSRFGLKEEKAWADFLLDRGIGLVCLAGLMRMLKGPLLDAFPGGIMNIHPSLLPAFPGLDSQGQALRYGVKVSGCTVHYVDRGMDSGPIILQKPVPVLPKDSRESLSRRILAAEHRIYPVAVRLHCSRRLLLNGRIVAPLKIPVV